MDNSEGRALPFIAFQEGKGYVLTEQAEQFLNSLSETKLGIISVVGKYRTGKSFFINRVILNEKKSGFSVGPTINPCTKVMHYLQSTENNWFHPCIGTLALEQDTES